MHALRFAALLLLGAIIVGGLLGGASYDALGGGVLIGLALAALAIALIPVLVPHKDRKFLLNLAVLGLLAKLAGTILRLGLTETIWGFQDADRYNDAGVRLAPLFRAGEFGEIFTTFNLGTGALEVFTGFVYTVTGPTTYGGFLVFSFLAFAGSMFFIRAFQTAFPDRSSRLFSVLVLLYPSVLFWPSSLGKDAPMFMLAGFLTWGIALAIGQRRISGVIPAGIGMMAIFAVRPHVALMFGIAAGLALVVATPRRSGASLIGHVIVLGGLVFAGLAVVSQAATFLRIESFSVSEVVGALTWQTMNEFPTGGSGSNFSATPVTSPLWVPSAFVTVLLRPFPWEAHSAQVLLQSVDGILMAGLLTWGGRRVWRSVRRILKDPGVMYAVSFMVMAVLIFSTLGNFGVLARQRAIIFPFVFLIVAAGVSVTRPTPAPAEPRRSDLDDRDPGSGSLRLPSRPASTVQPVRA